MSKDVAHSDMGKDRNNSRSSLVGDFGRGALEFTAGAIAAGALLFGSQPAEAGDNVPENSYSDQKIEAPVSNDRSPLELLEGDNKKMLETLEVKEDIEEEKNEGYKPEIELTYNFSETEVIDEEEISSVYLSTTELLHKGADEIIVSDNPEDQTSEDRLARSLIVAPALGVFEYILGQAAHEVGHGRGWNKAGVYDPQFERPDGTGRKDVNPLTAFTTRIQKYLDGNRRIVKASDEDWQDLMDDPDRREHIDKYMAGVESSGLTTQQAHADAISEDVIEGEAHALDSFTYFINAFSTNQYMLSRSEGDVHDYIDRMEDLGVETSRKEIGLAELSQVLSNSTLSFAMAIPGYIEDGDGEVEPIGFEVGEETKVYLPEFSSNLTLDGPTVEGILPVKIDDSLLRASAEVPLSGEGADVGASYQEDVLEEEIPGTLEAMGSAKYNTRTGGNWLEVGLNYDSGRVNLGLKVYRGDGSTFHRQVSGNHYSFDQETESGVKGTFGLEF